MRAAQLHAENAQISRHPPHRRRDDRPNHSDALAARGAAPSAGGGRQAGTLHCLRVSRIPAGPHRSVWVDPRPHWGERLWRHY